MVCLVKSGEVKGMEEWTLLSILEDHRRKEEEEDEYQEEKKIREVSEGEEKKEELLESSWQWGFEALVPFRPANTRQHVCWYAHQRRLSGSLGAIQQWALQSWSGKTYID